VYPPRESSYSCRMPDGRALLQKAQCLRALRRPGEALELARPAGEISRLLGFCALEWEDTTAVRQWLYDSSLTQWRHYAAQLEGLRHQLVAAGVEVES